MLLAGVAGAGFGCDTGPRCSPTSGLVTEVIDGDTVVLDSGERVRYLLVNTPEITGGKNECFGQEAKTYNSDLVLGKEIKLDYDVDCLDYYDRQLAYVSVDGREVNRLIIERGYGCVLFISPSGADREDEFLALEATAKAEGRGVWGACEDVPCEN